jgi:hypothetical protein
MSHKTNIFITTLNFIYRFFLWRAPQQMLQTHRSLEAYCTTLWWRWLVFFFVFPCNGAPVEWNWQGKTEVLWGKTCPSATLSTISPTWTDPGLNPDLRGERPAANRLSHGTAYLARYSRMCQSEQKFFAYDSFPSDYLVRPPGTVIGGRFGGPFGV